MIQLAKRAARCEERAAKIKAMLKQAFIISFRNIFKDKVFSFLNLANLVIGFATFTLFSLYIYYELNWDRHNANFDRIYRVQLKGEFEDVMYCTYTPPAVRYQLLDGIAVIEKSAIMKEITGVYLSVDNGLR